MPGHGHAAPSPRPRPDAPRKRKRNRAAPYTANGRPHKLALHPLKTRIRDLERQLGRRAGLPANVRVDREREVVALRARLADTAAEARRRRRIARYHMVRFFERKKAARVLRRAEKECEEARAGAAEEDVRRRLEERVCRARVDFNYAVYSPLEWKYCALWPKVKEDGGEAEGKDESGAENEEASKMEEDVGDKQHSTASEPATRGDPVMWERVRIATEEGQKALEALRDSTTSTIAPSGGVSQKSQPKEPKEPKSEQKRKPREETTNEKSISRKAKLELEHRKHPDRQNQKDRSDEESDGGFFE